MRLAAGWSARLPRLVPFCAAMVLLAAAAPLGAADDVIRQAMKDELERSMQKLRLNDLDRPYFIAYTVQDGETVAASATFGSLTASEANHVRLLTVEVRVGDYALDNTNFFSMPSGPAGVTRLFGGTLTVPLDDDYREIRRQIWLATDSAYKKALEDIARKRAAMRNRTQSEQLPDFSKEQPGSLTEDEPNVAVTQDEADRTVKQLSAAFRELPAAYISTVRLRAGTIHTYYLNSEGTSFTRVTPSISLMALAGTQAADGAPIQEFISVFGRSRSDLPSTADFAARIREMGERLERLRNAPRLDRYTGPVLFEGQAAAELFCQLFAPRLLAARLPIADNPQVETFLASLENPFLDKLGSRVLPDALSVADNPTLTEYRNAPLAVHYVVDDEGVRARENILVDHGILKTLLTTRSPVSGIEHSTGNRRGAGILPSNLIVTATGGLSEAALRERFIQMLKQRGKEFGIVIRRLGNPALKASPEDVGAMFMQRGRNDERVDNPTEAYKLFLDGHEELIRNLELTQIGAATFRDIVAASDTPAVYSAPFIARTMGMFQTMALFEMAQGEGGASIVSVAVPSLLFDEVSIRRPGGQIPQLPVSSPPYFAK
ncbi:MAG: metallopeptidase TldD-related protein [Terriglobia bacterium]